MLPLLAGLLLVPRATSRLLAGFSPEFVGRADGLPGLRQKYGLKPPPWCWPRRWCTKQPATAT
ncbi:hypothetical protein [Hymenobacter sp. AT01-02]|uniref:hypothetical protein n=1 Tax=Hymenobacter sp. AT01-02 TaxID=1571877 RepID=UPI001F3B3152|nr:hypothetical protein [Hymenobacter sp. AT01-02]